jgi:hypothetical protein
VEDGKTAQRFQVEISALTADRLKGLFLNGLRDHGVTDAPVRFVK